MPPTLALLFLLSRTTDALSARAWLSGGASSSPQLILGGSVNPQRKLELPLISIGSAPLLPGESMVLQPPTGPATQQLLRFADDNHQSCCGQLLTRGDPSAAEQELVGVTGVLEIARGYEGVRLTCVGRARLLALDQPEGAALDGGGFLVAQVELFCDEEEAEAESEITAALAASLGGAEGGAEGDGVGAAASRAVAASADGAGVSAAEVVEAAQQLLAGLDDEVREEHTERTQVTPCHGRRSTL